MPTQVQQAAKAPPAPSAAPATPQAVIVSGDGQTQVLRLAPTRMSSADIATLKARRSELSDQLQSVDSRRSKLLSQLQGTGDEVARKGLEHRISLLDNRQLQLESDLAETGRLLSSVPAGQLTSTNTDVFGSVNSAAVPVLIGIFTIFVLGPLALGALRMMWKRSTRPSTSPAAIAETSQRLERLEHSIDAIALEIERVSEGQRFVTKLLSDASAPLVGSGQRVGEAVRTVE